MTNKTILDRGFTTTTLPAPETFSFSKETRQLELIYYYQYCVTHNLISVVGDQSRTALILKTFNHKVLAEFDLSTGYSESGYSEEGYGSSIVQIMGYGYNSQGYGEFGYNEVSYGGNIGHNTLWSDAMRDWLQVSIPSGSTDLNELWIAYFAKYATTPDLRGVTYDGLSVEAAYRKFLLQNLTENAEFAPVFSDQISASDTALFKLKKFISDTVTLNDTALFKTKMRRLFEDSVGLTDDTLFKQKMFFSDEAVLDDATLVKFTKRFTDTLNVTDTVAFVRIINRAFFDNVTLSEALRYVLTHRYADSVTLDDALKLLYKSAYSDTVSVEDTATFAAIFNTFPFDEVTLTDSATFTLI